MKLSKPPKISIVFLRDLEYKLYHQYVAINLGICQLAVTVRSTNLKLSCKTDLLVQQSKHQYFYQRKRVSKTWLLAFNSQSTSVYLKPVNTSMIPYLSSWKKKCLFTFIFSKLEAQPTVSLTFHCALRKLNYRTFHRCFPPNFGSFG